MAKEAGKGDEYKGLGLSEEELKSLEEDFAKEDEGGEDAAGKEDKADGKKEETKDEEEDAAGAGDDGKKGEGKEKEEVDKAKEAADAEAAAKEEEAAAEQEEKEAAEAAKKAATEAVEEKEPSIEELLTDRPPDLFVPEPVLYPLMTDDEKKALDDEMKAIKVKFDEGELKAEEYGERRAEIKFELRQDTRNAELNQTAIQRWFLNEQELFYRRFPVYRQNKVVAGAFGRELTAVLDSEEGKKMDGVDVLWVAKKQVDRELESLGLDLAVLSGTKKAAAKEEKVTDKEEKGKEGDKTDGKKAVRDAKKAEAKKEPPKTLEKAPAEGDNMSEDPSVDAMIAEADRLVELSSRKGATANAAALKLERLLSKMPENLQRKWLEQQERTVD